MMDAISNKLYEDYLKFLRTGRAAKGLFAPDVVNTVHVPHGHYVLQTPPELEEELLRFSRKGYELNVLGSAPTPQGFIVEFTQRIPNGPMYEEMTWVTIDNGRITDIKWYCTGEVHEHRHNVPYPVPKSQ